MSQRSALRAFITKELRHIARDRQTLTILVLMPLVQVVLFGYALRSDVRDVRLAIVDPAPDYATTSADKSLPRHGSLYCRERESRHAIG